MSKLRLAFRQWREDSAFAVLVTTTLAIGIGAASAIFSLVEGVLLSPPPYRSSERLAFVAARNQDRAGGLRSPSTGQWTRWQRDASSFSAVAGYDWTFDYLVLSDTSEALAGLQVTKEYFDVLGVHPFIGRTFQSSEALANHQQANVILLGYGLWQRQFKGDTNILGQTVRLSRHQALTVIGVMPPRLRFMPSLGEEMNPNYDLNARVDYWLPVAPDLSRPWAGTPNGPWSVVARLRDGVSFEQAQAEVAAIAARQAQEDNRYADSTPLVQPLTTLLNEEGRRLLVPLSGAVALVFVIACGNAAGLLLGRGLGRQGEYSIRAALGASRIQLVREVFIDMLGVAAAAGIAGTGIAAVIIRVFKTFGGFAVPRLDAVSFHWPVVVFCLGASTMAAILAGIAPAVRASRRDPAEVLQARSATVSAGRGERRLLSALVVVQMALTLALLAGAGLLIQTVRNLAAVQPGYITGHILTLNVMTDYDKIYNFHLRALERIATIPGVEKAAFVWGLPLTGNKFDFDPSFIIEGELEPTKLADKGRSAMRAVTPDYFGILEIPVLEGRTFRLSDNWEGWTNVFRPSPGEKSFVCIINQAFADRYFPHANPIGRNLRCAPWPDRPKEIVGIVANTRTDALARSPEPEIYLPFFQVPVFTKHLIVRTAIDPRALAGVIQRELHRLDPAVVVERPKTLEAIRWESVASQRFAMWLLTGLGVAGASLASIGVYGVLSLSVNLRRKEMAIRSAVGAQPHHLVGLVLADGLRLLMFGLSLGASLVLAVGRLLQTFLFGLSPHDPLTLTGTVLLFASVALLAGAAPARRALRLSLSEVLRSE
ncbi:MAG: ADOP family duplicated permease [Verrucomicrobiota bacterium]